MNKAINKVYLVMFQHCIFHIQPFKILEKKNEKKKKRKKKRKIPLTPKSVLNKNHKLNHKLKKVVALKCMHGIKLELHVSCLSL